MARKTYQATGEEMYRLLTGLIEEGCDAETARDRLHGEVDEAAEYYIAKQEETDE